MPKKKKPTKHNLNLKQEAFCHEYIKDRNAKQAAIRVGYSNRTAEVQGSRLLSNVNVRYKINRLIEAQFEKIDLKAELILKELLKLATFDIQDLYDEEGNLLPLDQMPESVRKAIASIEVEELFDGKGKYKEKIGYTKKIRFWDKARALELLGKYLKMFVEGNIVIPGGKVIFQDIKIEGAPADKLITDINNRLTSQLISKR